VEGPAVLSSANECRLKALSSDLSSRPKRSEVEGSAVLSSANECPLKAQPYDLSSRPKRNEVEGSAVLSTPTEILLDDDLKGQRLDLHWLPHVEKEKAPPNRGTFYLRSSLVEARYSIFRNWCRPKLPTITWFSLKENHTSRSLVDHSNCENALTLRGKLHKDPEQPGRHQRRHRQGEYPRGSNVADGGPLQSTLVSHHRTRHAR
jgi:hypothetical protein